MQNALKIAIVGAVIFAAWRLVQGGGADPVTDEANDADPDILDYAAQVQDSAAEIVDGVDSMTAQNNQGAFLQALRLGEGTSDSLGYYRLCGGGNASGLAVHPALSGWGGWSLPYAMAVNAGYPSGVAVSTAAGAYQITRPTWAGCVRALGLSDFSESSQDQAALYLIKSKGALGDVIAGRTDQAIAKLGKIWASLPGAAAKQRQVTMSAFNNQFINAGGVLA